MSARTFLLLMAYRAAERAIEATRLAGRAARWAHDEIELHLTRASFRDARESAPDARGGLQARFCREAGCMKPPAEGSSYCPMCAHRRRMAHEA